MTNRIALALGGLLLALVAMDYSFYDGEHLLFLGKKLFVLLDWLAFWH